MALARTLELQCRYSPVAATSQSSQQTRPPLVCAATLLTNRRLNQGHLQLRSGSTRVRREVLVRADQAAKTERNGSDPATALPIEEKKLFTPGRFKWGLPNPLLSIPKTWRFQALAVGAVVALAAIQISAGIIERVEAVPFLAQFEIFVGTLFSLNLAAKYLGGGEGRVRLESFFEDMVDRIKGVNGAEELNDEEPSMLDVQLKSLVDQYLQLQEVKDASGSSSAVSVVGNKAALMTALRDFIASRELKSRRINALLRKDNAELSAEKIRAKELEKTLAEQMGLAADRGANLERLTGVNAALQTDKSDLLSQVLALSARMDAVTAELGDMTKQRNALQELNMKLEMEKLEDEIENDNLRQRILSLESAGALAASAVESANARRVEELLIQEQLYTYESEKALNEQRAITQQMEAALANLQAERDKAAEAALKQERQLSEAVSEMEERNNHISWLQSSLAEAQRRTAQNERFVDELRNELAAVQDQVATSQQVEDSHSELQAVLEAERKRYAETAAQLESQLAAVQREKEEAAMHIAKLEEALAQSELQVTETEKSAEELQTAINWVASPAKLHPATPVAEPKVPETPPAAQHEAKVKESPRSLSKEPAAVSPRQRSPAKGQRSPTKWRKAKVEVPQSEDGQAQLALSPKELQAFARSARSQFIDISKPAKGQEDGVDALVKELVARGATDDWARRYVMDSLAYERRKLRKQEGQESP